MAKIPKKLVSNERRLYDWIRKNAYTTRDEGDFIKIVVRHVVNKSKVGDEIGRFEVPGKDERTDQWDSELTTEIMSALQIEAQTLGGLQHYACYSVFSDAEQPVNRCIVTVQGGDGDNDDDDGLLSEGANAVGLTSQAMRHQEANARIMTGGIMQVIEAQRRQNERLMTMNEELLKSQLNMVKDMTGMWEEKRAAILEASAQAVKTHAVQEGISVLRQIGPVIVNKLVGKDILPVDKRAGVTSMAKSFYGSLTEEQLAALQQVFRQDQLMHFFTLGETLLEDEPSGESPQGKTEERKENET